jgi:hypothetical protein
MWPMHPADKNYLTRLDMSGRRETGSAQSAMDEPVEKQWSKRHSWATCHEPYKTELDAIGSQWIEGALSNEELAFEAVQMLSELEWVSQPGKSHTKICMDDVIGQVKVLTEAMLAVSERPPEMQTPESRQQALDFMQSELGKAGGLSP